MYASEMAYSSLNGYSSFAPNVQNLRITWNKWKNYSACTNFGFKKFAVIDKKELNENKNLVAY